MKFLQRVGPGKIYHILNRASSYENRFLKYSSQKKERKRGKQRKKIKEGREKGRKRGGREERRGEGREAEGRGGKGRGWEKRQTYIAHGG